MLRLARKVYSLHPPEMEYIGEGGLSANDKKGLAHEIPDTPLNGRGHTNLLAL